LLHQFPPARLSIDIDVLLHKKDRTGLLGNLEAIVKSSGVFKSVEEDKRESAIPKAHYKFWYDPFFCPREESILLDVVFCEHPYHSVVKKKLKGQPLILSETDAIVNIPTPEGLFGDKMTAISPKTIGFRLTEGRDMEYLKQIIDLGSLFDTVKDITDIRKTFINTSKMENEFRKPQYLPDEILDDIIEVAFRYSQWLIKGADNSFKEIEYINKGFDRLSNHLVARLRQDDLKIAFGKAAYTAQIIRDTKVTKIIKNIDLSIVDSARFDGRYKILDGLKKRNTQAYFYWALSFGAKS